MWAALAKALLVCPGRGATGRTRQQQLPHIPQNLRARLCGAGLPESGCRWRGASLSGLCCLVGVTDRLVVHVLDECQGLVRAR